MDSFAELAVAIHRVYPGSRLEPLAEQQLADLRRDHPNSPTRYVEFLKQVGWGSLARDNFMLYDGLVEPSAIYDPVTAAELDGILLFGDDFDGWVIGFDTHDEWRLVGVENGTRPEPLAQQTLVEFFTQRIASAEGVDQDD